MNTNRSMVRNIQKRKRITLDMRNGAVGLGGYPTVVTALPIYYTNGELSHYLVSHSTYMKAIANDDLVCARSHGILVMCGWPRWVSLNDQT